MSTLERIILHELGHLVVDLSLSKWSGWMIYNKLCGKNQFFCEPFQRRWRDPLMKSVADWENMAASAYGGYAAVECGISRGYAVLNDSNDPPSNPGRFGFDGDDSQIVDGILAINRTFDPGMFHIDAKTKADNVVNTEFTTLWNVTQRIVGEINTKVLSSFYYDRMDLSADFPHLEVRNI
ncbi:hypothetical protein RI056_04180 [Komagataeibacter nataicola]|uniref:hypothetical protein n=1 Tax=Komagataeibacter nataicola TaxID=265960 RepID=UPI0028B0BE21|nr:hypothetical protein [Komagataeibacter nataicola]WNM09212.1 hypothetical protein RI056_04180 [Komagataeibacter nataicola]